MEAGKAAQNPISVPELIELLQLPLSEETLGKLEHSLEQHYYQLITDPNCEELIVAMITTLYQLVQTQDIQEPSALNRQLQKCLWLAVRKVDPSLALIKQISRPLASDYEKQLISAGKLHLFIRVLSVLFQNQTPVNRDMNSFLYLTKSEGITMDQPLRFPFEKHPFEEGGTFSFWFLCQKSQEEAKLMSLLTKERVGFEIFLKNDKIYYQPLYGETSKSWIKPKSTPVYLSDLPIGRACSLSIEFELKRKIILKSTWLINLHITSDRLVSLNNIEIDMPQLPSKELSLELFKGFEGCISSVLLLSKNLARHLEENNIRGFMYENEIRNFTFLSEGELKHVVLLYTPIRSARREHGAIELFDVYGRNNAVIPAGAGGMLLNLSIKKEIGSYGGMGTYLSILKVMEDCPATTSEILNDYLRMLINIFLNKSGAQEEAASLNAFALIKEYLVRTRMKLIEENTVYLLKELFCSLSNKGIRQSCLKTLLWGLDVSEYLQSNLFELYMKGLGSLYNEDLQSTLPVFGIRDIINYISDVLEARPICCRKHGLLSDIDQEQNEYQKRLRKYFEIIQSIIEQKSEDASLPAMVLEVLQMFTLKMSACLCEVLLDFIDSVAARSSRVEQEFSIQLVPIETKLLVYSLLANINSVPVKARVLKLIFKWHGDQLVNRQRVAAYELLTCLRALDSDAFKNSVMSHDDKFSMDSEDKSSEPKSTSLTELLRNWNRKAISQRLETMDHPAIVDVVIEWAYNQPRPEESCNNGLLLLADLYCMASNNLKKHMWHEVGLRVQSTRFDPDLLLWLTEALLIEVAKYEQEDHELMGMILEIIVFYEVELIIKQEDSNENAVITSSIIQTVFAAKFNGQPRESQLVAYLYIFEAIMKRFDQMELKPDKLPTLGSIVINSCYKHLIQYFMLNNFENESDFEQSSEDVRMDQLPLQILDHLLSILQKLVNTGHRLTSEESSSTNQRMLLVLFQSGFELSSAEQQEQRPSLLCMVFISLQWLFDNIVDSQLELKQHCLRLIESYLLLMMELSENSGSLNFKPYECQLSTTFLNVVSFLEIKFYQYFHFQPANNLEQTLQNTLRHNASTLSQRVVDIFVHVLQLLKYIGDVANRQHRSFYELMRPKNNQSRFKLNCLYSQLMKQIDDRVIEFYYIEDVGKRAREKLEASLLDRKISRYSMSIEKVMTKKMDNFLEVQKRAFTPIVNGSLSKYNDATGDKYKLAGQFEEQLNLLRLDSDSRQRTAATRRLHMNEKFRREVRRSQQKLWQASRLFEGIWACTNFYHFSQNDNGIEYNNELLDVYERSRSRMQTRSRLKPFMKIKLKKAYSPLQESLPEDLVYLENFVPARPKAEDAKKSERYLKLGLQFIKKKFIDRIMRSSQQSPLTEQHYFNDVLWNHKLSLWTGDIRLSRDRLEFCYKQPGDYGHLALFKFRLRDDKPLVRSWRVSQIESLTFQKFLLKNNTAELLFKDGRSLLFTFLSDANKCVDFAECLARVKRNLQPDVNLDLFPTKIVPPMKLFQKSEAMRKWLNGQLSNFDYLLNLNFLSGRSNEDLNQYPVLPWIRSQYDNTKDKNYRDLGCNMGCLGTEQRREKFRKVYESSQHFGPTILQQEQFHYGFHYSNLPIVLQFLIRCNPYTEACKMLQGGKFDVPDRLFSSLADSFNNAVREMSDVREVIPEFYYFPEFLLNSEQWKFGVQQNNHRVDNVELPEGCSNAYEFIEGHREALESDYASENLHKWIDLVFGYKNCGKEAELSMNKFFYLTYEDNSELVQTLTEDVTDRVTQKRSLESQIAFYGKTPSQLLTKPHPQRRIRKNHPLNLQKSRRTGYFTDEKSVKDPPPLHHPTKPFFCKTREGIVHFSYCPSVDKYVILRRDGIGRVFSLDHDKQSSGSMIDREFQIDFDHFEYSFSLDERAPFKQLPIIAVNAQSIIVGGVWGGRLLCFDITNDKVEAYCKHSETVTALTHCQSSKLIASGSYNGQVILWEYNSKMKVLYHTKLVHHYSRINHLAIEDQLRLLVSAGEDGLVVLCNLFSGKLLRTFRFAQPVSWVLTLSYPYHMLLINAGKRQLCYSINGQFLDQAEFDVALKPQLYRQMGYQDRAILKLEKQFVCLSLPDFRTESRYCPNRDTDHSLSHFIVRPGNILFAVDDKVVYAYEPEEDQLG